jgi:hypothetical protein
VKADVVPWQPDLLFLHCLGDDREDYHRLYSTVSKFCTADVVVQADHVNTKGGSLESLDVSEIGPDSKPVLRNYHWLPEIVNQYKFCWADIRTPWKEYLVSNNIFYLDLLRDGFHCNDRGHHLTAHLLSQFLIPKSDFESIDQILLNVIHSFSIHIKNTASSDLLIIKHHPMDRGHHNYKKVITRLAKIYCIEANIVYIHDIPLPYLLKKISGCITVNSTIGLQSLHYQCPVINLGKSFYDKPGLTFQGSLDEFWISRDKVNAKNAAHFRNYLLHHTQVNGSLYDPKYRIE